MKRNLLTITLFSILAILPVNIFAQQNPFPGCNFVLEDASCKSYFGYSEAKVQSLIGVAESYGDYYRYGVHLYYGSGLQKITFYGIKPKSDYIRTFSGKPSRNLNWGASPEEVISKYRQPDSQKKWELSNYVLTELYYDKNIVVSFRDNKLASISLIDQKEIQKGIQEAIVEKTNKLENAFADCQFIIEDVGCRKFYGKSGEELNSIFGDTPKNGSYSKLGIWFYMWSPSRDKAKTVGEVKFYGKNIGDGTRFSGKPGKNLDWNASPSDVIKIYGKPASQSEWTNSDKTVESAMGYGNDLSMRFENEKLVEITLTNPKYIEESDAYLEKEKQKYLEEKKTVETRIVQERAKEKAKSEATEMEADYKSLLETIELYNEEGERILKQNMTLMAMGGQWAEDVRKKLDKVNAKMDSAIDRFLKKYEGQVPDWMIKGIQAKRSGQ